MQNHYRTLIFLFSLLLSNLSLAYADTVNINVAMPSLSCSKAEPPECTLSGEMIARGPAEMTKPIKFHCDIKYSFVAAGSEQQEIRFNSRVIHHSELTLKNGRLRKSLNEPVNITLSKTPRSIEISTIYCYADCFAGTPCASAPLAVSSTWAGR